MKKKTVYTQEFKETAIKLALAGNKSMVEVARELKISDRNLYEWVSRWKKLNGLASKKPNSNQEIDAIKLQKRVKELEMENEILKKAAAYFAKTLL
jgi:transposase